MDWDKLGFSLVRTDYMFATRSCRDGNFEQGYLSRYGNIELNPAAGILNYGQAKLQISSTVTQIHYINGIKLLFWWILQGLIEGMKAYRGEDGRILLFRPELNAMRMKIGAERMCMHSPSVHQFIEGVKQTVLANRRWVQHCRCLLLLENDLWFTFLKWSGFFFIRFLLRAKDRCISDRCCLEPEQAWVWLQHQSTRFLCLALLFKTTSRS